MLNLPTSIGEAIDKLTILDIKLENIKNAQKISNIKIEYDILHEKLIDFTSKYESYYNVMKYVNNLIWKLMDILRDGNTSNDEYLINTKKCVELNDVRFRIKNKINYLTKSILKEEKGYNTTKIFINTTNLNIIDTIKIIKYYSILYDDSTILCNQCNYDNLKSIFEYDSTIHLILTDNSSEYSKILELNNKNINNYNDNVIYQYF